MARSLYRELKHQRRQDACIRVNASASPNVPGLLPSPSSDRRISRYRMSSFPERSRPLGGLPRDRNDDAVVTILRPGAC